MEALPYMRTKITQVFLLKYGSVTIKYTRSIAHCQAILGEYPGLLQDRIIR
jgi:hypothetical protein